MDFALNLVLSLTDNMSSGLNNAYNSLNDLTNIADKASSSLNQMASLSALSVTADRIGNSFLKAGGSIMSVFSNVLNQSKNIGSEFEDFDVTLTSLFGGAEKGAKKSQDALNSLFEFSKKSPLEVGDVKDMIVTLQSQGINAFEKTKGAVTGTRQEFLAFLTDLKSFKPEVQNERFKMAIQNYIGSGEKKQMRTVFDMGDIEDIIGHSVSKTAEGRMNDIVEMVENKGLTGLSEKMSKTWGGVASNISDAFTQVYYSIANNGVFDKLKKSFVGMANSIIKLNPDKLASLGKTVADGLNIIVNPIVKVSKLLNKFIKGLINLCSTNPKLVKLMMTFGAIAGVFLMGVGVVLKLTSAFSGLTLMLIASGKQFTSISGLFSTGIKTIMSKMLPLMAVVGLLAVLWKSDFAGIRTNVTGFVQGVQQSFADANDMISGSVDSMVTKMHKLQEQDDFFSGLTLGIAKVEIVMKALSEGWSNYTLSDDTFQKARKLGVLPLIEAIFDLKFRMEAFVAGFKEGWKKANDSFKSFLSGLKDETKGTFLETFLNKLTDFLGLLTSGDLDAWKEFGNSFGKFTYNVILFTLALKGLDKVLGVVGNIGKLVATVSTFAGSIGKVGKGVVKVFGKIFPFVSKLGKGISDTVQLIILGIQEYGFSLSGIGKTLETVLSGFSPLAGVASVVGGLVTAFSSFFSMLKKGFSWIKEILMVIGVALATIGVIILAPIEGIGVAIAAIVGAVVAVVMTVVVLVKQYWNEICGFFSTIGNWIYTNVIQPIANFFVGLWNGIVSGVSSVVSAITGFFSSVANWIYTNVINPIVNFFSTYIFPIISKVVEIVMKIVEIIRALITVFVQWINSNVIQPIIGFFQGLWNGIVAIFQGIASFFGGVFSSAVSVIKTVFGAIGGFFSGIWGGIKSAFSSVVGFFSGIFSSAVKAIKGFFNPIIGFFKGLWDKVTGIFKKVGTAVGDAISGAVKGAINFVIQGAVSIINGFIKAINSVIGVINKIPGVSITKISKLEVPKLATGGVVDKPTLSVIGEAGKEAVVPLENNIGWISSVADKLATKLTGITNVNNNTNIVDNNGTASIIAQVGGTLTSQLSTLIGVVRSVSFNRVDTEAKPVASRVISAENPKGSDKIITNNANSNQSNSYKVDRSVTFGQGSIVLNVKECSEKEAERFAELVMKKIKRKQEIDKMTNYELA